MHCPRPDTFATTVAPKWQRHDFLPIVELKGAKNRLTTDVIAKFLPQTILPCICSPIVCQFVIVVKVVPLSILSLGTVDSYLTRSSPPQSCLISLLRTSYQALVSGPNGVAPGPGGPQFMLTSLYVGDPDASITDEQLFQTFSQVAHVASVRVCRDLATGRSISYDYVNYNNPRGAARALDLFNFTPLYNKPIHIMYSQRHPNFHKSGTANIFIKETKMFKRLKKAGKHTKMVEQFGSFDEEGLLFDDIFGEEEASFCG
ncbi:hypothetical protein ES288_A09G109900v1 [Gossypium darwinii]|uniref:RRM domain-containing protein n=1 Tax=Gossypium darwinii TaxID=34276 RepID=A0A5D2F9F0_GOSDA|nr:hypothetical protein ES288_A09G109900v1 [Gossypium darwinii]